MTEVLVIIVLIVLAVLFGLHILAIVGIFKKNTKWKEIYIV